jgi:hypothetical protein
MTPGDRRAYSLGEVAAMLGKSTRTLKRLHEAGKVPGKPLGRDIMVPAGWVAEYGTWDPS